MKYVSVQFEGGFAKLYTYSYDETVAVLEEGDHVVVDTPQKGYAVAKVVKVDVQPARVDFGQKWKPIVCKVYDHLYKEQRKRDEAIAEHNKAVRARLAAMPPEVLEKILGQYEDF